MVTEEPKVSEAELLGVKESDVKFTGFKGKDNPEKVAKEKARHKKFAAKRVEKRIEKVKKAAKMKPIDKRKALLTARFKNIKSRTRSNAYSDRNLKDWIEELNMIKSNPKAWNKATANGTHGYVPSNKKNKTAEDILDGMDLE